VTGPRPNREEERVTGIVPSIRVRDMAEALRFYCGPLEFALERGGEEEGNSAVTRGDARIMLETLEDYYGDTYNAELRARVGTPSAISLYIEAPDLDDFYARLQETSVRIVDPLAERPWGQVEFTVEDHEKNWLTFWAAPGAT
jgi:uncharacterized glyoxalase superfamily protein PhnB